MIYIYKEKFINILKSCQRDQVQIDPLINYLDTNKFFSIASRKDEGMNFEGSLLKHSLSVYDQMCKLNLMFQMNLDPDSIKICALLHDVCCIDEDNKLPMGHGEKSVFLIQKFLSLTNEEIIAINSHLGIDDLRYPDYNGFSKSFDICPLALALYMADLISSCWIEKSMS